MPPRKDITVAAVVKYARELRARRERARANDPYADPYAPSDDVARKLSQQHGPEQAIVEIARRVRAKELEAEEHTSRATESRLEHRRQRLEAAGGDQAARDRLSLGQRLDTVLRGLGVISDVPAAHLGERVTGSKEGSGVPRLPRDRARRLVDEAEVIVEQLEGELDRARRRPVSGVAA